MNQALLDNLSWCEMERYIYLSDNQLAKDIFNNAESQIDAAIDERSDDRYDDGYEDGKEEGYDSGYDDGKQLVLDKLEEFLENEGYGSE